MRLYCQHLPELPLLRFRRKGGNFFRLPDDHDFHFLTPPLRPREGRCVALLCDSVTTIIAFVAFVKPFLCVCFIFS